MIDDLDDLLNMQSQRKRGQKKGDTFQVDFIDLDQCFIALISEKISVRKEADSDNQGINAMFF